MKTKITTIAMLTMILAFIPVPKQTAGAADATAYGMSPTFTRNTQVVVQSTRFHSRYFGVSYATRIKRFYYPTVRFSYYDPYFDDSFWYGYQPYWGTGFYLNTGLLGFGYGMYWNYPVFYTPSYYSVTYYSPSWDYYYSGYDSYYWGSFYRPTRFVYRTRVVNNYYYGSRYSWNHNYRSDPWRYRYYSREYPIDRRSGTIVNRRTVSNNRTTVNRTTVVHQNNVVSGNRNNTTTNVSRRGGATVNHTVTHVNTGRGNTSHTVNHTVTTPSGRTNTVTHNRSNTSTVPANRGNGNGRNTVNNGRSGTYRSSGTTVKTTVTRPPVSNSGNRSSRSTVTRRTTTVNPPARKSSTSRSRTTATQSRRTTTSKSVAPRSTSRKSTATRSSSGSRSSKSTKSSSSSAKKKSGSSRRR